MLTAPRVTQVCCQLKHQLMLLFSTASVQHMPVSLEPLVVANSESGFLTLAQAFQIADVPCCCRMLNWSCFYVFRQCRPAVNCILMCELPALIHMRRLTAAQTHCSADSLQRRLTAAQSHCSTDWLISCFVVLQEVRRVWLGYMFQCDSTLGQKLAAKCQAGGQM